MKKHLSERRLAENEVMFRDANEAVQEGTEKIFSPEQRATQKLHFYCECAEHDCRERIRMTPAAYKKLHSDRRHFLVKPGHEIDKIERPIKQAGDYLIVEKFVPIPSDVPKLQTT